MGERKKNYFALLALAIFAAGILIYGWNLIHGRNLAKPPKFDLSVYEDLSWFTNEFDSVLNSESEPAGASMDSGYIYFKDSFRMESPEQTNGLITAFLQGFSGTGNWLIENFQANAINADDATYIARVKYQNVADLDKTLEKMKNEHGGIVLVK